MEGAARVFAGEFCRSTWCRSQDQDLPRYVVTPTGACCSLMVVTAVLTETAEQGGGLRCRLADPTGAFDLIVPEGTRSDPAGMIRKMGIPSFISVNGRAGMAGGGAASAPVIRADTVRVADRAARDAWIARTAELTLQRIGTLARALLGQQPADGWTGMVLAQYRTTPADLLEYLALVETAVAGLPDGAPPPAGPPQDAKETVTGIIRDLQGRRGVAIDDVIAQAELLGIPRDPARAVIDELIREDECYQPQKGVVRLL